MHTPGHVGVGLVLYAPAGYVLVPAPERGLLAIGLAVVTVSAVLPDVDEHLPLAHRGPTHSIVFVTTVALVAAAVGALASTGLATTPGRGGTVVGIATALGTGSHLLIDGLTPMGIRPFWPVSDRRYTLALVPSKHPALNAGLLALGVAATVALVMIVTS